MPLLDHFRPPLSKSHSWRTFHGTWAEAIARLLNQNQLPPGYYALPFVDGPGPIEVGVAALRNGNASDGGHADSAAPRHVWATSEPAFTLVIDPPTTESVRVEIHSDDGDPQLVAAIEFVSPPNRDREANRQAFAAKCVGYLSSGGLVTVDLVTTGRADMHAAIVRQLNAETPESTPASAAEPRAYAYRALAARGRAELRVWPAPLAVGRDLPTLPLWIGAELAVSLDLEASYSAACDDLRIRHAG